MTLVRFQMCIGGQWVDAQSGKTFDSLNPATAQAWAELPDADEADVERAVQAAQRLRQPGLARPHRHRARQAAAPPGRPDRRKQGTPGAAGKPRQRQADPRNPRQVGYLPEFFHYTAGLADKLEGGTLPLDKPDLFAYTVHEPWAWSPRSFPGTARCT
jgi:acyl-CoA reductase-like NAD-dependent aldehyde dehydrogenase